MHYGILLLPSLFLADLAQSQEVQAPDLFADPVPLLRDGANHTGILYPSPVLHNLDGEGQPELLIGDLRGYITYSHRVPDGADHQWGPAKQVQSQGKALKLDNW